MVVIKTPDEEKVERWTGRDQIPFQYIAVRQLLSHTTMLLGVTEMLT
jgi:hypothetical protein